MADMDFTSVYRQFFEHFARTLEPKDCLPIRVASYSLAGDELIGEVIDSCIQYLTDKKCPQALLTPLVMIAVEEIRNQVKPASTYEPLQVMQMSTSKINEVCLRYTDNELLSSLPAPVKEPIFSHHGIKHLRRRMEDRLVCIPRLNTLYNIKSNTETNYYGLFDGHNGSEAASFAVSHLHQFLVESEHYPSDPVAALRDAFAKTETRCNDKNFKSGTTVVAVLHQPEEKKLIVAWLGDSQAALASQEGYLMLTDPHKPEKKEELERIQSLGGIVLIFNGYHRINGQLAVARALGNKAYKPYVSAEPDIRVYDLTGTEEFLVIGCDGMWDYVKPREVIDTVYQHMKENKKDTVESVSRRLVDLAKAHNSLDNISVIVVFLADPFEIGNSSVEARGPWPKKFTQNGEIMETNFEPVNEKSPFLGLNDQGMNNRIYEENGRHADFMDQLKDDSDEDFGPETDIDAIDDVLVSPAKCMNPFANDLWKKSGSDSNDMIDYASQESIGKDSVNNFTDNISKILKENSENHTIENEIESLDKFQLDSPDGDSGKIHTTGNSEFIEDVKFGGEVEKPDPKDHSFSIMDKAFDLEEFDKSKMNSFSDGLNVDPKDVNQDMVNVANQFLCNGNGDIHGSDKMDLEKPVSPTNLPELNEFGIADSRNGISNASDLLSEEISKSPLEETKPGTPESSHNSDLVREDKISEVSKDSEIEIATSNPATADTNLIEPTNELMIDANVDVISDATKEVASPLMSPTDAEVPVSSNLESALNINLPQMSSDSENLSQKDAENETSEVLSPVSPHLDDKLEDEVIAESGGEVDSEDGEWSYHKVSAPADERFDLVAISQQVGETDKLNMTTPLNPDAAEFIPLSPASSNVAVDGNKTPLKSVPQFVNDVLASTPNWSTMDDVRVPDETAFLTEVKSRPSNVFKPGDGETGDLDDLGCAELNLDDKDAETNPFQATDKDNSVMRNDLDAASPVHGIALAKDMTSSFIDPSTISADNEILEVAPVEPEIKSAVVNLLTEANNKLPDLLTPFTEENTPNIEAKEVSLNINESIQALSSPKSNTNTDFEQSLNARSPIPEQSFTQSPVFGQSPTIQSPVPDHRLDVQSPVLEYSPNVQSPVPDHIPRSPVPDQLSGLQSPEPLDKVLSPEPAQIAESPLPPQGETPVIQSPEPIQSPIFDQSATIQSPVPELKLEAQLEEKAPVVEATIVPQKIADVLTEKVESENSVIGDAQVVETKSAPAEPVIPAVSEVKKEDPKKAAAKPKVSPTKKPASPALSKTPTTTKSLPAVRKSTSTQPARTVGATKPSVGITASSKSVTQKASPPMKTAPATARPATSAAASRPRTTPPTGSVTASKPTTGVKTTATRPLTAPPKSTTAPRTSALSATAAKPKPRVSSAALEKKTTPEGDKTTVKRTEVLAKKPVTSTLTSTTKRTVTSQRPTTATSKVGSIRSVTTTTTTRTTTSKPKTALNSVSTSTTTTTRTVLNSKKPSSVASKDLPNKTVGKSSTSKMNGVANGKVEMKMKTSTASSVPSTKSKIEDKTETKAENVIKESVELINIENNADVNLINGLNDG